MADFTRLPRSHRRVPTSARVARSVVILPPRSHATARELRLAPLARRDQLPPSDLRSSPADAPELNPYVDYARYLTAEGGVLFIYKDHDLRWRHTLWRLFAWVCFTGPEAWAAMRHYDDANPWFAVASIAAVAILNIIIVAKPVEHYRRIEIRPDCLIIEGQDVFWMRYMDGGFPSFRADEQGNSLLCGVYGTRFVQFLIVRRFDEFDRTPEIFAAHLHNAMQQLWTQPP